MPTASLTTLYCGNGQQYYESKKRIKKIAQFANCQLLYIYFLIEKKGFQQDLKE